MTSYFALGDTSVDTVGEFHNLLTRLVAVASERPNDESAPVLDWPTSP
jgi:hypothetical protein